MNIARFLVFFMLLDVFLFNFCYSKCDRTFLCQNFRLEYPLTDHEKPDCGFIMVDCHSPKPHILLGDNNTSRYEIINKISADKYLIHDKGLRNHLARNSCISFGDLSVRNPDGISINVSFAHNFTLFTCDKDLSQDKAVGLRFEGYRKYECKAIDIYYRFPAEANGTEVDRLPGGCSSVQLPLSPFNNQTHPDNVFTLINPEYYVEWHLLPKQGSQKSMKIALASSIPGAAFLVCLSVCFLIWLSKRKAQKLHLLSRNVSSDPSSKSDLEGGGLYFGIPIFSYTELVEATNNFDSSEVLGDGGFGTVYYGKLRDGREVAVKRLYEHNYRRVEQFMNEIQILTCLRHPNLVSLYGCTSRRSRELLLVYEYVCNGTVADHLHGEKAKEAHLTWAIRMSIAIEAASALSYLHKSDIIHRDMKTNNILLDENFRVKVADFGLSRLFPNDVTHISTAPQGTPGYVDPEYHQCYQLTDRSDVYSFGVVLVELISSMPAVDINRHRHEINLANLALNKIQRCAFDELIDPSLGYKKDPEATRMTTSVAELASRCLQLEKEMRPSMVEVLDILKDIQNGKELKSENGKLNDNGKIPHSPETDESVLLKNKNLRSPVAVTDKWSSSGSTTSDSIA